MHYADKLQKYQRQAKYPHMQPRDAEVWSAFIEQHPDAYDIVAYDVGVGDGPNFDPTVNLESGGDNFFNYQHKIDVVAFKGDLCDVIEIKPTATMAAMGQAKGYASLFAADFPDVKDIRPVVIARTPIANLDKLMKATGVAVLMVH